jgi:predicted signal transduction protein with EAL and GGDEF domain
LTGLYNRRIFDEKILSEIATCAAHDAPISILIVDVDYFKNTTITTVIRKGTGVWRCWETVSGRALPVIIRLWRATAERSLR